MAVDLGNQRPVIFPLSVRVCLCFDLGDLVCIVDRRSCERGQVFINLGLLLICLARGERSRIKTQL